jgi:sugar/nucleoside kinase (ribokinase family)
MHVLVVGTSVIDLFLTIDTDHFSVSNGKVLMSLGDKIPSDIKRLTLGGNGANVSVGLTKLEIPTSFYTYLGADILSREIEDGLTQEGVELVGEKGITKNSPLHVIFDFNDDRIIFSHYQRADYTFDYNKGDVPDFIFLTSIADSWEKAYRQVLDYAIKNRVPIAFSPGTRQLENLKDIVFEVLKHTKIFFSNKEEAKKILKKTEQNEVKDLLLGIKSLGPDIVSITDGANGAYAIDKENATYTIGSLPSESTERTGAGDAYAAGFFAGVIYDNKVKDAMRWGALNANSVMQHVGAQSGLITKRKLDSVLKVHNNLEARQL